ncbi:unnamed protein product [Cylicocyclus nassatus]|uniref:Condensin complex subunit 1 C-terminal domain-containing protein n=1 Tax=Cylicocyclus nassatus TaxID=53992 RepID=A0AA36DNH6_CYLNA|nr:unnamed protein product [Cylicocyclus nassatus]
MASISELIQFLSSEFSLSDITDECASLSARTGYNNFTSISNDFTPAFFDDGDLAEKRIYCLLTKLATFKEECDDPNIWNEMAKINVSGRQLCMLLWFPIEWALIDSGPNSLKMGALAACAYIHLASIKGSKIHRIFDHHLYKKCLHLFRASYNLHCTMQGSAKMSSNNDVDKRKQGGFAHGVDEFSVASFDISEYKELLFRITETLFVLLRKEALDVYPGISHETAMLVRDFARIDVCANAKVGFVDDLRDFKKLDRFIDRSFALMHHLISSKHTIGGYIVTTRIIYPRLAFWTFDCDVIPSSIAIPTMFTTWRDLIVEFVKVRVSVGDTRELMAFFAVLDNLYHRCTDRLDYRTRVAQSVLKILQVLPRVFHYEFVRRVDRFSRDPKVSVRNFTIEIAPLILMHLDLSESFPDFYEEFDKYKRVADSHHSSGSDRSDDLQEREDEANSFSKDANASSLLYGDDDIEDKSDSPKKDTEKSLPEHVCVLPILYQCIIRCCLDKASSVRIRAMHHLASLLSVAEHRQQLRHHAETMLTRFPRFLSDESDVPSVNVEDDEEKREQMSFDNPQIMTKDVMLHIIVTNAGDDTVGVRKNAANVLRIYFPYLSDTTDVEDSVECLKELCLDGSSVVRKQAIEVVDFLYNNCTEHRDVLENAWLDTVFTMINDREPNLQNIISQLVTETLLTPILDGSSKSWKLLHSIALDNNKRRILTCALLQQHRKGQLNPKIIDSLNLQLEACPERSDVIWMLLAELSAMLEVNPLAALRTWYSLEKGDEDSRIRYITRILSNGSRKIGDDLKKILIADIRENIISFRVHTSHISSVYHCLAVMMDAVGEEGTGIAILADFGHLVLDTCCTKIRESLLDFESFHEDAEEMASREETLIRMVMTMGDVVQFSPSLMRAGKGLFDVLKSVLAFDTIYVNDVLSGDPSPASSRAQSASSSFTSYGCEQPIVQPIAEGASAVNRFLFTPAVRACAILTIGKFCLMDERFAKATIPVFVKQLRLNPDHVIRNNILIVLSDLCIRYTSTVDRYSAVIAACLKDRSTLIRHQCLESLTSLINERFIKWEGEVMYRFLSTVLDENRMISDYAKFCLRDVLLPQYPDLFVSHFIECLTHFNNVSIDHEKEAENSDHSWNSRLCMSRDNRMIIYTFMLSTFDDTRKLTLMSQICTQVLCPLMSGKLKYESQNAQALVKDALTVMSLNEMKLNADLGKDPNEEEEPPAAVIAVAKEIITKAFRKAMLEYVMPTLLDLRIYLNEHRSELRKELYNIFRAMCRDHKDHVDVFLGGDEQLKAEVEFELRRIGTDRANSYGCLSIHRLKHSAQ